MGQQFPGHDCHIIGAGIVIRVIGESGAVHKMGVCHSQGGGSLVHFLDKAFFRAGNKFRQSRGTVVGGNHRHALEHFVHGHLLPFLQPNLAAAHTGGMAAGGDGVSKGNFSPVYSLQHQQQGHNFGHAGNGTGRMGVFFVEHRSRGALHQAGGRRGNGNGVGGQNVYGSHR